MIDVLFLDDCIKRHDVFINNNIKCRITSVYYANEAIQALKNSFKPFDLVMLDHDLGEDIEENEKNNGYTVAKFIADMPEDRRPLNVIIHSWNGPAAQQMMNVLTDAGFNPIYMPFNEDMLIQF